MTKSIFEKAYITEKQCEAAIAKAFGDDAINYVAKKGDDRKWRVLEIPAVQPAPVVWSDEALIRNVMGESGCSRERAEEALAKLRAKQAKAKAEEEKTNLTLAEALEESGETIEELKDDSHNAAMAQADRIANASMGVDALKPRFSTCERPTKKVWHIADAMPGASRKAVMEECIRQGVSYGTARTQYQAWFKASQECMPDLIRKPYQKGTDQA